MSKEASPLVIMDSIHLVCCSYPKDDAAGQEERMQLAEIKDG